MRQTTLCEFNGKCLANEDWCNEEIKKRRIWMTMG